MWCSFFPCRKGQNIFKIKKCFYSYNSSRGNFYPFLNANGEQPAFFLKYFPKSEGLLNDRTSAIWAIEYELVRRRFLAFAVHDYADSRIRAEREIVPSFIAWTFQKDNLVSEIVDSLSLRKKWWKFEWIGVHDLRYCCAKIRKNSPICINSELFPINYKKLPFPLDYPETTFAQTEQSIAIWKSTTRKSLLRMNQEQA